MVQLRLCYVKAGTLNLTAKIAKKAGQIKDNSIKKLHSTDLRKAAGIPKKVIK